MFRLNAAVTPLAVVVGRQESSFIFHHVCTKQERVSRLQLNTQISQDEPRFFRRKVADACADVERERGAVEGLELERVSYIVPDDRL